MSEIKNSVVIDPTVGRVVLYVPAVSEGIYAGADEEGDAIELAAVIAFVDEKTINLAVFDQHGRSHARQGVTLVQDGDELPGGAGYAHWMPFQLGQAAFNKQQSSQPSWNQQNGQPAEQTQDQAGQPAVQSSDQPDSFAQQDTGIDQNGLTYGDPAVAESATQPAQSSDLSGLGAAGN